MTYCNITLKLKITVTHLTNETHGPTRREVCTLALAPPTALHCSPARRAACSVAPHAASHLRAAMSIVHLADHMLEELDDI